MDVNIQELENNLLKEKDVEKKIEIYKNALTTTMKELQLVKEQLSEANGKLKRLSYYDELTGIPNRRYFSETLDIELRRLKREKEPISIIMVEIDNFKNYNDNYGHLSGEDCIKKISRAISDLLLRASDFVARFGREVFMVVLPNTDAAGACEVGEKIKRAVETLEIENIKDDLSENIVTISAGTGTVIPYEGLTISDFIYNADAALKESKLRGGNTVTKGIIMY